MSAAQTHESAGSVLAAYLLLAFTALCWGGNAVLGRLAVGEVSPVAIVLLRWLGACLILAPFVARKLARDWPALRPHLPLLLAMGALGFAIFNVFFYVAAHYTSAINMGILQGSIPVFVLIGAFAVYGSRITAMQSAGVALTIFGVVLVAAAGSLDRLAALNINPGDILMIAACALYSGYAVGLRKVPPVSSLSLFAVVAGTAFLVSVPLALAEAAMGAFQWPTAKGWGLIAIIVLGPSLLAQIAFIKGVNAIGPGRAGVFVNLVPVFASFLAVVFLGEAFRLYHALALALVLGGIAISERFKAVEALTVPASKPSSN